MQNCRICHQIRYVVALALIAMALLFGEIVSGQNTYQVFAYPLATLTPTPSSTPALNSLAAVTAGCVDPLTCDPVFSIPALWRCITPGCYDADWVGSVIAWPSWAACGRRSWWPCRSRFRCCSRRWPWATSASRPI